MIETQRQGFLVVKTKDLAHTVELLISITAALKILTEATSANLLVTRILFFSSLLFLFLPFWSPNLPSQDIDPLSPSLPFRSMNY